MENSTEFQMKEDDAEMVEDILNELNSQPVNTQTHPTVPQPIPQPLVHADASILQNTVNHVPNVAVQKQQTQQSNVTTWWSKLLSQVKKPAILISLIFILFNPIIRKLLSKSVPQIFQSTTVVKQQLSIFLLATIVGVSYVLIDKLL